MDISNISEPARRSAHDRLLAAADELFYAGGIHSVGIDRVIERAGVAKASLYACFGSKDGLVRAYLQARHQTRRARLLAALERYADPRERLLGVFDAMENFIAEPNFRGCAFTRAGAESAPGSGVKTVCDDARGWMRQLLTELAVQAGAVDADGLARQLAMLYDGASVSAQLDAALGGASPAGVARAAAALLLDAACADRPAAAASARRRRPVPKAA